MSEKHRKEIESLLNKSESGVNKRLQKLYKELAFEINDEIVQLAKEIEETDKFSKKLQKERLEAIRSQMFAKVSQLEGEQKKEIFDFLRHDGHVAFNELFYDFEMSEEIPLSFTMLTDKQINVIINTPVANRRLSTRLKGNSTKMKQNLNRVLTRGFAKGLSTQKMAVQIAEIGGANYRRALNIARTESGRVTSVARQQSQNHAKSLGIKLEKQWISTLDKLTRSTHQDLDGKIVGIDEYFEIAGHKALQPHMFGVAAEDCNCRCRTITIVNGMGPELRRDNESKEVIEYQNYDEWLASKDGSNKESNTQTEEKKESRDFKYIQKDALENYIEEYGNVSDEEYEILTDEKNGYIRTSNSFRINKLLRGEKMGLKPGPKSNETIELLSEIIERNQLKEDILVDRWVDNLWMNEFYNSNSEAIGEKSVPNILKFFNSGEATIDSPSFVSASLITEANVFNARPIKLEIQVPKGSNVFVTKNVHESEIILNKDTKYEIIKAELIETKLNILMRLIN